MSPAAILREPDAQPQALGALLSETLPTALGELPIRGISLDSRQVKAGDLFLACQGLKDHGLAYLDQVREAGAAAVAWESAPGVVAPDGLPTVEVKGLSSRIGEIAAKFYATPSRGLFVVGITGTDGKTSCAWILAQAMDRLGLRCGYLGTLGYGFVDAMQPASHTTPDAVRLQYWLAKLGANDAAAVALEVSSHALSQGRADAVDFDMAVLTNVGRDHLDYHGDLASYAAAKRRLFETPGLQAVILNQEDACGREWLTSLPGGVAKVAYGVDTQPNKAAQRHVLATSVETTAQGLQLDIHSSWGDMQLRSRLLGRFNASNLLACLAVLLERGVAPEAALATLSEVPTVPGRMQAVSTQAGQPLVVVDYAHTPQALEQALQALRAHCEGRLICIFGCGGERDQGKRPLMGAAAARADRLIVTDDNPRAESPDAIVAQIVEGIPAGSDYRVEHDRATAIHMGIAMADENDVVIIAGKGHEDYQLVGTERRRFSDVAVARQCLTQGGDAWTV